MHSRFCNGFRKTFFIQVDSSARFKAVVLKGQLYLQVRCRRNEAGATGPRRLVPPHGPREGRGRLAVLRRGPSPWDQNGVPPPDPAGGLCRKDGTAGQPPFPRSGAHEFELPWTTCL